MHLAAAAPTLGFRIPVAEVFNKPVFCPTAAAATEAVTTFFAVSGLARFSLTLARGCDDFLALCTPNRQRLISISLRNFSGRYDYAQPADPQCVYGTEGSSAARGQIRGNDDWLRNGFWAPG